MPTPRWHDRLETGRVLASLSVTQLWWGYFSIGGCSSLEMVHGVLAGVEPLSALEYDMYAQALNDHFTEAGMDHPVPFSDEA